MYKDWNSCSSLAFESWPESPFWWLRGLWAAIAANHKAGFCPAQCRCQQIVEAHCLAEFHGVLLPRGNSIVVTKPYLFSCCCQSQNGQRGWLKSCFNTPLSTSQRKVSLRGWWNKDQALAFVLKYNHWIAHTWGCSCATNQILRKFPVLNGPASKSVRCSNSEEECSTHQYAKN